MLAIFCYFLLLFLVEPSDAFMVTHEDFEKMEDYYRDDPTFEEEMTIFNHMRLDLSLDFVIDLSYCPKNDQINVKVANSPVNAVFFNERQEEVVDVSDAYYEAIGLFIDWASLGIRPNQVYTALIDNGQKFYIRGRPINQTQPMSDVITLADLQTHSRTLWPHMTGSDEAWHFNGIFQNNLGHLTKLALVARDNGLPVVLKDRKELVTAFTVVITDGANGSPAYLYSADPSKTMVIDIGGGSRYAQKLKFTDISQYAIVVTLDTPQALPLMANTARFLASLIFEL